MNRRDPAAVEVAEPLCSAGELGQPGKHFIGRKAKNLKTSAPNQRGQPD
jgi:hypothetical protein